MKMAEEKDGIIIGCGAYWPDEGMEKAYEEYTKKEDNPRCLVNITYDPMELLVMCTKPQNKVAVITELMGRYYAKTIANYVKEIRSDMVLIGKGLFFDTPYYRRDYESLEKHELYSPFCGNLSFTFAPRSPGDKNAEGENRALLEFITDDKFLDALEHRNKDMLPASTSYLDDRAFEEATWFKENLPEGWK